VTSESERDGARADQPAETDRTGVFVVGTDTERDDAFEVRRAVFVDEQGVDAAIEYDEHDEPEADATHFVAYAEGEPIGAARLRSADGTDPTSGAPDGPLGKVERVAVASDRRGEGWGRRLMVAVEAHAREAGFDRLTLHAQTHVREFYERLEYEAHGEEFEEAGIPHVAMDKDLDDDS
jgi:predicted GNAT family N-acyltransferase